MFSRREDWERKSPHRTPGVVRIPVLKHSMPQVEDHSGAELCTFVVTVPVSNVFAFTVRTHIHH